VAVNHPKGYYNLEPVSC